MVVCIDFCLEIRLMCEEFCAVVTVHGDFVWEGCFWDEAVVDAPWFEKTGSIWGELETSLHVLIRIALVNLGCGGEENLRRLLRAL